MFMSFLFRGRVVRLDLVFLKKYTDCAFGISCVKCPRFRLNKRWICISSKFWCNFRATCFLQRTITTFKAKNVNFNRRLKTIFCWFRFLSQKEIENKLFTRKKTPYWKTGHIRQHIIIWFLTSIITLDGATGRCLIKREDHKVIKALMKNFGTRWSATYESYVYWTVFWLNLTSSYGRLLKSFLFQILFLFHVKLDVAEMSYNSFTRIWSADWFVKCYQSGQIGDRDTISCIHYTLLQLEKPRCIKWEG